MFWTMIILLQVTLVCFEPYSDLTDVLEVTLVSEELTHVCMWLKSLVSFNLCVLFQ